MADKVQHRDFDSSAHVDVRRAIQADDVETLRRLIDTRFGVHQRRNTLCLYESIDQGNLQIVKMLLDAGVDRDYYSDDTDVSRDAQSSLSFSPLYAALSGLRNSEKLWQMIKLLVESGVSPKNETLYEDPCIFLAIESGDCDMVKFFCDAGAQVNCRKSKSPLTPHIIPVTPLQEAVSKLHGDVGEKMVELLIDMGADVNAKGSFKQRSCLHIIADREEFDGRCEMSKLLLEAGAQVNYIDESRSSPLNIAISKNDCELMKVMIAAGAHVNLTEREIEVIEHSPLGLAVMNGNRDAVRLLLESGANISVGAEPDINLLRWAGIFRRDKCNEIEYLDILKMLLPQLEENRDEIERFILLASVLAHGTVGAMRVLFENDITLGNCDVRKPLHFAAKNETKGILEHLLKSHHYDVDKIDYFSGDCMQTCTPLFVAVDNQRQNNVRLLVDQGAEVNISATEHPKKDAEAVVTSPLYQALYRGGWEIIDLLLSAGANMKLDTENKDWGSIVDKVSKPENYKALCSLVGEVVLQNCQEISNSKYKRFLMEKFQNLSSEVEEKCLAELEILKNHVLYGSITLYDLLRGKDVTRCVKSTRVDEIFESFKVLESFPIYGNRIANCYSLAKVRREVVDVATKILNKMLELRFDNYHEILNIIISHLRLKDLHNLCLVCKEVQVSLLAELN